MLKTQFSSKVDLTRFGNELFNYEDEYVKKKTHNNLNKTMLFLSSERLSLSYMPHWIAIVTTHLPTIKWHKWILTFNFENNATQ